MVMRVQNYKPYTDPKKYNHIIMVIRKPSGKCIDLSYTNSFYLRRYINREVTSEDTIMLVEWGGVCVYSKLLTDKKITIEDLLEFFNLEGYFYE